MPNFIFVILREAKNLFKQKKVNQGFTLIELLVVVSIITILSVTGLVLFQNTRNQTLKSKRLGDLDAIKKAYEKSFDPTLNNGQGGYKALVPGDFSEGKIPTPDGTTSTSYFVAGPNSGTPSQTSGFAACINKETGASCLSPAVSNCSCVSNTQGIQLSQGSGGGGGGGTSSCDPYGQLLPNLVGYWNVEELGGGSSTTADSIAGASQLGTLIGSPTWLYTGLIANSVAALNFNYLSSQYISVPNNINLNPQKITISAWIKPSSTQGSTEPRIISKINTYELIMFNSPQGRISFKYYIPGETTLFSTNNTYNAIIGSWNHVVATFDGTTARIYVNGQEAASQNTSGNMTTAQTSVLQIGGRTGWFFNGGIDKVRIYNQAVTPAQVNLLYNSGNGC